MSTFLVADIRSGCIFTQPTCKHAVLQQTQYRNAEAVTIALLRKSGAAAGTQAIKAEVFRHPDFPAMESLCEILPAFQFKATIERISRDEIAYVKTPFIIQTFYDGLVLVAKIEGNWVYAENENGRKKLPLHDFTNQVDGTILTASSMLLSVGKGSKPHFPAEWAIPIGLAGLAILFITGLLSGTQFLTTINIHIVALALLKTAGLAAGILLLTQTLDHQNALISRLCAVGRNGDCSSILNSKAAKITSWLSWSEVGFFYFAGTWLALLTGSSPAGIWQTLMYLNMVCLPYTFWSIWYQFKIARKWCVLCCSVQAILWMEFVVFMLNADWHIKPVVNAALIISLLLPVFSWMIFKQVWLNLKQKKSFELQLHFTKFNVEAFKQIIHQQPVYPEPDPGYSIVLGNPEPSGVITMVTNPYCGACVAAHQQLTNLLSFNRDLQARIIFVPDQDGHDQILPVSRHFMSLHQQGGSRLVTPAMHSWYQAEKTVKFEEWGLKYPAEISQEAVLAVENQRDWCLANNIKATPTILLNGHLLPGYYQLADLKYLLNR